PWIESFGCTAAYRELRERIRRYYRDNYPLVPAARARADLNPGNGRVSRLCCEPRAALGALEAMLAPHSSGGRCTVLLEHQVTGADVEGARVRGLAARDLRTGREVVLRAPWFIDATELGDVLPLAGAEHVTGAEARRRTGEPHAPEEGAPANQQAITACFAMDHLPGEDHGIDRPPEWELWRDFVPKLAPPWPGRLLSFETSDPRTVERRKMPFDPEGEARTGAFGLWTYRRIADAASFAGGTYAGDITLVNWPQNDYFLGNLVGVTPEEAARHVERAKGLSLSLLYWLQTEAPRPDGGTGFRGLRLRPDVVGTADGLAKRPYVRESRRIAAVFTVLETHVGTEARARLTGKRPEELEAEPFGDSVGVGSYRIDLHPSTGGDNYIDVSSLPFQIPLGALLPVRLENLLPGAKNLGVTHITNGCYRLHPVEWNIGEAAGSLCAFAAARKALPREVREKGDLLEAFQRLLRSQGVETHWPRLTPR
ncbi:MAG: FAD-dependent oxidoreductase, partial [Planctomycetes bacterium]|nr:FAD-dependent oxidoreductase [Planctomycetota bacterium]